MEQQWINYGSIIPEVWGSPKLLAEAKSDKNERSLISGDLTRSGPVARRIDELIVSFNNESIAYFADFLLFHSGRRRFSSDK